MSRKAAAPPSFVLGLTAVLALTWAAFEWSTFTWSSAHSASLHAAPLNLLEVEVAPTSVPVKPPPPPAPPVPPTGPPEPTGPIRALPGPPAAPTGPTFFTDWDGLLGPDPEPVISSEPVTLLVADHMPAFGQCVNVLDTDAERQCTEQAIIAYMQDCVEFPRHMKAAGISGTVYLEYVIDEFGKVRNPRILRAPHPAFEGTTLDCIEGLPAMHPGRQQGRPVRVQYTLPIRFSLR